MADLNVLTYASGASMVAVADEHHSEIYPKVPSYTTAPGDVVFLDAAGKATKTTGSAVTTCGLALEKAGTRQAVSVLKRGVVGGFDLSAVAYGAKIYLSDTAGKLSTTAGTTSVVVGKVIAASDPLLTKVLYLDFPWLT